MIIFRIISFLFAIILLLDGLILIILNKINFGTVLPVLIGLTILLSLLFKSQINRIRNKHLRFDQFWKLGWGLFGVWLISLFAFFIYLAYSNQNQNFSQKPDAIIVLGSGLIGDQPSPTLQARLDRAAELTKQFPKTHVIVTGGLSFDQKFTEAEVMKKYLIKNYPIDPQLILEESESTSTELNLKNSVPILKSIGFDQNSKIVIVTSDFHTPRAAAIAKHQGYSNIISISSHTPISTRYNAWLREYFAYISGWILREY